MDITFPRSWLGKPLTRCLTPTGPREDGRWRTLSRCSINAGPRNLITPLGGDIQYLFAMFYSDYFPKVLDCDQKIVKAVLAYLEDPDAPEGTAFVRYLAVRCFVGDTIKWSDMI